MAGLLLLGGFVFFLLILTIPVPFALGLSALVAVWVNGTIPLMAVPLKMVNGIDSFILLAVPFFILAAELLNASQITTRIFNFADSLVGHVRGGLGHVNVLGSMIFSGMTGSAIADVAGLGSIEVKAMLDAKYDRDFTAAVTAASAVIGPIIPPSIPMIIYGSIAEVSVGKLFVGGIVPGTIMGLSMMGAVWWITRSRGYEAGVRPPLRLIVSRFLAALPSLFTPVLIIGGMMGGIFTPTEASVVAVLYAMVLAILVYRELPGRALVQCLSRAATSTAVFLMMLATASVVGLVATRERIPAKMEAFLRTASPNPQLVLLLVIAILLFLGCFIDVPPLIVMCAPFMAPLMNSLGFDPVHFGVLMVCTLMIGGITPPFGTLMFIACRLTKTSMIEFARASLPFYVALVLCVLLVAFFPQMVLFLANRY